MAIYHCSIKIISRSSGRSAVACAAYRAGEKLYDKETGTLQDYTSKGGVILNEIKLPFGAPAYLKDRETLWNEVQMSEKQSNAQLAREVEVAFPKEFDRGTQMLCAWDFIEENFTSKGMIADWALHDKGDGNPHAHIMLTVREVDKDGKWMKKQKSVFANARDKDGVPIYDPDQPSYDPKNKAATAQYRIPDLDENGNQKVRIRKGKGTEKLWVRISIPANGWNDRENAEKWRASWAKCCNRYLEKDKQIDHRSYARQGIEQEPTVHEGVTARKMERSGKSAERCEINRNIKSRNRFLEGIRNLSKEIKEFIYEKVRPVIEGIRRCTQLTKGQGSYYFTDPFTGTKQQSIGRETEKSRETAERIKHFKRNTEQTDRDIAVTDRYIENALRNNEIYKRNIGIHKPDAERTDYRLEEAERFVSKGCQTMIEEEKHPVKETEVQKTNTAYRPILNADEYVPRL
ncbi:MAG: MobA/MobL family protein [Parasporobacterium sp.]|nr:MobA/MobL family protein [Parasporobacterium sp.]